MPGTVKDSAGGIAQSGSQREAVGRGTPLPEVVLTTDPDSKRRRLTHTWEVTGIYTPPHQDRLHAGPSTLYRDSIRAIEAGLNWPLDLFAWHTRAARLDYLMFDDSREADKPTRLGDLPGPAHMGSPKPECSMLALRRAATSNRRRRDSRRTQLAHDFASETNSVDDGLIELVALKSGRRVSRGLNGAS